MSYAGWIEYDKKDNAAATATRAAVTAKQHIVYSVTASLGTAATPVSKTVALVDGVTTVWEAVITTGQAVTFEFPKGIALTAGAAVSATLEASGTATVLGTVSINGETV